LKLPVKSTASRANEALFAAWQAKVPVAQDDSAAKKFIASIDQPTKPDGAPHSGFTIRWRTDAPPPNVRWLPVASVAVAVEDVKLTHRGNVTQVQYSTEVFDSGAVPGGVVGGVLVFDAAPDRRLGVDAPVRVLPADTGAGR
jgi:hypothetical protein